MPFIVFLLLLTPLNNIALKYSMPLFLNPHESSSLIDIIKSLNIHNFFPYKGTYHLWFLYYLMMFSIFSFLLFKFVKRDFLVLNYFNKTLPNNFLSITLLSIFTFIIIYFSGTTWIDASISFFPNSFTFMFYLFFYVFGWMLFLSKKFIEFLLKYGWNEIILGVLLFSISFIGHDLFNSTLIILINSVTVWFFCFGFIGLFIKHFNKQNSILKYISDSSYWIYLLHLPLTLYFPGFFLDYHLPIGLKFSLVVLITLILCLITYHFFVRKSFIGVFLNGKKF